MGAIKLIDLDQEIFVPIYDEAQDMTYEQIVTVGEFFDRFLGQMPTLVDAIPVEWLEQRRIETSYNGAKPDVDLNYAFCAVINEWMKEQEAQDG